MNLPAARWRPLMNTTCLETALSTTSYDANFECKKSSAGSGLCRLMVQSKTGNSSRLSKVCTVNSARWSSGSFLPADEVRYWMSLSGYRSASTVSSDVERTTSPRLPSRRTRMERGFPLRTSRRYARNQHDLACITRRWHEKSTKSWSLKSVFGIDD